VINVLLKAIDLMDLFSPSEPRLTLAEISRRLDLPKSTAHRLLATLLSRGFIEKPDADMYALGTAVVALTQSVRVNAELRDRVAPLVRDLADACRESVLVTVRDGDTVLYIYAVESPQRLLARTAIGDHAPLYCTAAGKAFLAFLPSGDADRLCERMVLEPLTPHTITDRDTLRRQLACARADGYTLDCEEHERQTYCVGAPIWDAQRRVIGAISVSGADPEIIGARLPSLSAMLLQTTEDASRRMGYVPAMPSLVAVSRLRAGCQEEMIVSDVSEGVRLLGGEQP